jgi:CheY-like chemotaxis protein
MPGMDGLTLLREIKTRRPDLPVMMVTAYGDEERRRRAPHAATGMCDVVFRFARDSPVEGDGFEPSVPRVERGQRSD